MEKVTGKPVPDIKFFNMDVFQIAGCKVRALRHGMVGQPGWELFGPWADGEKVREAIVEAGREFGIRKVGARTYPTSTLESGWIPSPLPAVYTGELDEAVSRVAQGHELRGDGLARRQLRLEEHRELLPDAVRLGLRRCSCASITSSSAAPRSRRSPRSRSARKSRWSGTATTSTRCSASCSTRGKFSKYIDLPLANYSTLPFDKIVKGGKTVGLSTYTGYSFNERAMLSLACIDVKHAKPGTKVSVVWGEDGGGTKKPTVERHNAGHDPRDGAAGAVRRDGAHGLPAEVAPSSRIVTPRARRLRVSPRRRRRRPTR